MPLGIGAIFAPLRDAGTKRPREPADEDRVYLKKHRGSEYDSVAPGRVLERRDNVQQGTSPARYLRGGGRKAEQSASTTRTALRQPPLSATMDPTAPKQWTKYSWVRTSLIQESVEWTPPNPMPLPGLQPEGTARVWLLSSVWPNLYLCQQRVHEDSAQRAELNRLGICAYYDLGDSVLQPAIHLEGTGIQHYEHRGLVDGEAGDLMSAVLMAWRFLQQPLRDGKAVMIGCRAARSRSVSVISALFSWLLRTPWQELGSRIKEVRNSYETRFEQLQGEHRPKAIDKPFDRWTFVLQLDKREREWKVEPIRVPQTPPGQDTTDEAD